jgi:tetratricopeptide (TPR) repeat protein
VVYPLNGLANLYVEQGKYAQAEPLYQRALHIREQSLGPEHLETAESLHDLATFQERQGNRQEALSLSQRAFAIRKQALGPGHPKTAAAHEHLTSLRQVVSEEADTPPRDDILPEQGEQNA